mgnify:CR=1 FL=1
MYDLFTSRDDVKHAMGFRVWGRNSIKNHSLTLLDINLCIKSGLNTSFLPLPDKFTCSKSRCTYIWGVVQRREYAELLGQIQNGVLSLEAWWFFDSKPDQNIPLWNQKWKGNMLQNTRLQRNGRLSPKSDDTMNGSCVKTQTPRIWSQLKLTSNWFKFIPRGCSKDSLIRLRSHWSSCQAAETLTFNVCYMTRWEGTHLDTRKRYLKQAL